MDEPDSTSDAPNQGAGSLAPSPRVVGRYEIVREIGRGGMAIVYMARQRDLDRTVALKELSSFHAASSPEFAERFLRESRLAGSLSHPNIVTVHDYFEEDATPYIAMEYVSRGSLRPWVGSLSLAQLAGTLEGILAGLAHAEQAGIVHRDLKPENIMVTAEGRVKITDFGIAKASEGSSTAAFMTATGMTVGTPTYMAPEQAMARQIGPWTDLYSVGVMAYEQIVGHAPFRDTEAPMVILMRHVNEPIPALVETRSDVDPALSEWVGRLLVKDPAERTHSAAAAWEELEEIVLDVLGPRWRREARLPERSPTFNTPKPLTPAPFESQRVKTPPMTPAAPTGDFRTFNPSGPPQAPSPPLEAQPREGDALGTPAAPAEVDAAPSAPAAPVDAAVAPSGPPSESQAPAPEQSPMPLEAESRFITFEGGQTPHSPPAAAEAPPEAVPDQPPPPAYEPSPATPAESASADQAGGLLSTPPPASDAAPPEPATPPGVEESAPDHAPVEQATPTDAPRLAEEGEPAPSIERHGRKREDARVGGNRRLVAATAVAALLAALVGFALASASSGGGRKPAALTGTAAAGSIKVSFPSSWRAQASAPTTPGLQLAGPLALVEPSAGAELIIGRGASPGGPTLLPASLVSALQGSPHGDAVRLGGMEFYRYRNLQPSGAVGPETIYALSTSSGTVLAVCVLPSSGSSTVAADCERIVGSLKLTSGSALPLGPNPAYAEALNLAMSKLNTVSTDGGPQLTSARTPAAQASAAERLARAETQAAAAVQRANPGPLELATNTAIATSLAQLASSYSAMASAARSNDRQGFDKARASVMSEATTLKKAIAELRKLGYETSG